MLTIPGTFGTSLTLSTARRGRRPCSYVDLASGRIWKREVVETWGQVDLPRGNRRHVAITPVPVKSDWLNLVSAVTSTLTSK